MAVVVFFKDLPVVYLGEGLDLVKVTRRLSDLDNITITTPHPASILLAPRHSGPTNERARREEMGGAPNIWVFLVSCDFTD